MKITKKLKLILSLFLISLATVCFADNAERTAFTFDKSKINNELSTLNELETYVNQHEGISAKDLKCDQAFNPKLIESLDLDDPTPLNIPSFWWGFIPAFLGSCIFYGSCWVGSGAIIFIYLATDKNEVETRKALVGCIAGSLVGWGTLVLLLLSTTFFTI